MEDAAAVDKNATNSLREVRALSEPVPTWSRFAGSSYTHFSLLLQNEKEN